MAGTDSGGQRQTTRREGEHEPVDADETDLQERHEKLSEDVDAILDEIDVVLE